MPDLSTYVSTVQTFRRSLGAQEMNPLVYVERDGELVATLLAGTISRDEGLLLARTAAVGFGADALTFVAEMRMNVGTVAGEVPVNPISGLPWAPGQMQALAEDGAGEALGIMDCLLLMRVVRGGDKVQAAMLGYRVAAGSVDFFDSGLLKNIDGMSGYIADALMAFFIEPTVESIAIAHPATIAAAEMDGLTVEEQKLIFWCVAAKFLDRYGCYTLLHTKSDFEREVYVRHLSRTPTANVVVL